MLSLFFPLTEEDIFAVYEAAVAFLLIKKKVQLLLLGYKPNLWTVILTHSDWLQKL